MLRAIHAPNDRRGFTLVEMLVSSALILFIMYILASCFQSALSAFGQLKAAGDLQERLRLASMIVRDDLKQEHFDGGTAKHFNDGHTLGQQRLDKSDWQPPDKGFFRIYQGSPSNDSTFNKAFTASNGVDVDGLISYQVINHYLHFTVHLGGVQGTDKTATIQNGRDQVFQTQFLNATGGPDQSSTGPYSLYDPDPTNNTNNRPSWISPPYLKFDAPTWDAGTNSFLYNPNNTTDPQLQRFFYSPWAEVAYYLRESGQTVDGTKLGTKLYVLYRRQRLLLDDTYVSPPQPPQSPSLGYLPPTPAQPALTDMSFWQRPPLSAMRFEMNTPSTATVPQRRFGMDPGLQTFGRSGVFNDLQHTPNFYFPIFADNAPPGGNNPPPANTNYGMHSTSSSNQDGDDVLLSDVLSFEVKVDWTPPGPQPPPTGSAPPSSNDFPRNAQPPILWNYGSGKTQDSNPRFKYVDSSVTTQINPDYPFDDLPPPGGMNPNNNNKGFNPNYAGYGNDVRLFDTWSHQPKDAGSLTPPAYDFQGTPDSQMQEAWSTGYLVDTSGGGLSNPIQPTTIPLRIRVRALQIRIRIWDAKAKLARQITIVQDL